MKTVEQVKLKLCTLAEVAALIDAHKATVRRLWQSNAMPPPMRVGGRPRWRQEVINEWIAKGCPRQEDEEGNEPK